LLGDKGPGERGTQQVVTLVDGSCAQDGEDEVADELVAQVDGVSLDRPRAQGLHAGRFDLVALPDVGSERYDLGAVLFADPVEDHGGVKPSGVGEHYLAYVVVFVAHGSSWWNVT